ncbi:molybdate ABC transporter substrate-binding protein [Arthrobacter sp. Sr24]
MRLSFQWIAAVVAATLVTLSLASCSPISDTSSTPPGSPSSVSDFSGTLTVFAAASLKNTFTDLAAVFEAAHPEVQVSLSFDGSSTLVTQIIQGAPADVLASADTTNMTKLSDAKMVSGEPVKFATNVLTLVVPPNNPANIANFADATKTGTKLVICAAQVPCGAAALSDAKTAGLTLAPVSEELNVTSVLGKVTSGAADAGLVYLTDAESAGEKVKSIPLQLTTPTVNDYPIAVVQGSKQQELAQTFIALVTAAQGQKILQDAGFGTP